ncbi:unnamed protein product [Pylaiella littoralis]
MSKFILVYRFVAWNHGGIPLSVVFPNKRWETTQQGIYPLVILRISEEYEFSQHGMTQAHWPTLTRRVGYTLRWLHVLFSKISSRSRKCALFCREMRPAHRPSLPQQTLSAYIKGHQNTDVPVLKKQ